MKTPGKADTQPGKDRPSDHESVADDRFIHGLLGLLHKDTGRTRDDRIKAVFDRIGQARQTPRANRRRLFLRLVPLATAAVLTLVVATVFVFTPQSSAYAMVGDAINATRLAPQLRYEILLRHPALHSGEEQVIGVVDMRGEFLLVRIEMPEGHDFIMGRDSQSEWSLRADGSVERFDTRAAAPRWINLGESTILVGGLDALLDELRNDQYTIARAQHGERSSRIEGLTHLVATRRPGATEPGADRIDVWIDDHTSLVERLELHWDLRSGPAQRPGPPQPSERESDAGGPHPPPPERIVFQRVTSGDMPDDQFSPPEP